MLLMLVGGIWGIGSTIGGRSWLGEAFDVARDRGMLRQIRFRGGRIFWLEDAQVGKAEISNQQQVTIQAREANAVRETLTPLEACLVNEIELINTAHADPGQKFET